MQYRIKLLLIFLIIGIINADSLKYNNPNNHGVVGLINTPTARFYDESSYSLTLYRGNPDRKVTVTMMPYDWLEASFFYTSIKGRPYGGGFNQDYKDKGFNAKLRLKKEGTLPAVAIGFNDLAGTGIYSSEYIVASYGINNLDMHFGIGWGRLNGGSFSISNPLSKIHDSFSSRCLTFGCDISDRQGGTFRWQDYFSGKKVGIFGGISYLYENKWLFKYEHDSTNIPADLGFPERSNNNNLSVEYIDFDNFAISLNHERGDYYGVKILWKGNSTKFTKNQYRSNQHENVDSYQKLKSLLNENNIGLHEIKKVDSHLLVDVNQFVYSDFKNLSDNVKNSLSDSKIDYEEVIIKYSTAGLSAKTEGEEDTLIMLENSEAIYKNEYEPFFSFSPNIVLRPFLASRENFLRVALLAEFDTQYVFNRNLFWTTNLKYALFSNFDDLVVPPRDTYPNQVRSDIKKYLNNFDNSIVLGRSQLDYFRTISDDHHILISAGILEEMFSGFGIEYLWNSDNSPFAIGIESFHVYKRDYNLEFDLLDYSNTTSHINFYYENSDFIPFTLHLSYGEYLAGDKGYTFDISRRFSNGVKMGAFITKTNVTAEQFGEGSFDKGVYFSVPINQEMFSFIWRPLTKDPGAKLNRKDSLYNLLRSYKN